MHSNITSCCNFLTVSIPNNSFAVDEIKCLNFAFGILLKFSNATELVFIHFLNNFPLSVYFIHLPIVLLESNDISSFDDSVVSEK